MFRSTEWIICNDDKYLCIVFPNEGYCANIFFSGRRCQFPVPFYNCLLNVPNCQTLIKAILLIIVFIENSNTCFQQIWRFKNICEIVFRQLYPTLLPLFSCYCFIFCSIFVKKEVLHNKRTNNIASDILSLVRFDHSHTREQNIFKWVINKVNILNKSVKIAYCAPSRLETCPSTSKAYYVF